MSNTTIPPIRESELLDWSQNLLDKLLASPASYGVQEAQVIPFGEAQDAFKNAYTTMQDPAKKGKPFTEAKNNAKTEMKKRARLLISTLEGWPEMTDTKRAELQIPIRDSSPTPIDPPTEMIKISVASVEGRLFTLSLRDQEDKRRKPAGATAAYLYAFVGADAPPDLKLWQFKGGSGKSDPQVLVDDDVPAGTPVWFTALYVNAKLETGPACSPVKSHVNFEGMNNQAAA